MTTPIKVDRPLSPHLTIYRPQLTSTLSILHRITGIGLTLSIVLIVVWFFALSLGSTEFVLVEKLFELLLVRVILICSVWALWYHTCTGIRHLIWDFGYGLEVEWITPSAIIVVITSSILTLATLYVGWYT